MQQRPQQPKRPARPPVVPADPKRPSMDEALRRAVATPPPKKRPKPKK